MANEKNPFKLVLSKHRVSFVHLKESSVFTDKNGNKSEPKYNITFLIPKDHPDVDRIKAVIKAAYTANKETLFKGLPFTSPKFENPLKDGDEYFGENPDRKEYEDMYYLKASSKLQPAVFDTDKQDIIDLDEVYSGCYCRGVIAGWAYNNLGKGVSFFLNSVMKIEDGERLGGFTASVDDYDEEEDLT